MTINNRTSEFHSCIESLRSRANGEGAMMASQLMHRLNAGSRSEEQSLLERRPKTRESKSDFGRMASNVGREIALTASKLDKLTKLAKKKSLFNDNPMEIQELTGIIKQDVARLNGQIKDLETYLTSDSNSNPHIKEHSTGIVTSLRSQLASTSMSFKDVLEIRTQNMKEQQIRKEQFSYSTSTSSTHSPLNNLIARNPLYLPEVTGESSQVADSGHISIPMPSQALQLVDNRDKYLESRSDAIEGIEKTIGDLANIFSQLTTMISAHDDLVRRIDDNVMDAEENVNRGQQQLMKYMNNLSSNRWLMAKIFSVLIFFFLVFVLFFA